MENSTMNDLPKYEASPAIEGKEGQIYTLEAYLLFREHWEPIDLVFKIESPKTPKKEDITKLLEVLEEYKHNPIILEMFLAADDLYLDSLTERELDIENMIRSEIYRRNSILKPKTREEGEQIAISVREDCSHLY